MKKFFAMILSLALVFSLSVPAFAADITTSGDTSKTVTGVYSADSSTPVYSVSIAWGDMSFTYNAGSKGTWSTTDHTYSGATNPGWSWTADTNKITISNDSNAAVKATFNFQASVTGVTGSFYDATTGGNALTDNAITVASAEPTDGETAGATRTGVAYFQVTGGSISANGTLGTITVTLS